MNRYIIQKSTIRPNGWVLTDKENSIVVAFDDGDFNGSQRVTMLGDAPYPPPQELARIMRQLGEWAARHHGSKCFSYPYGFEIDEDDGDITLYRRKPPKWRLKLQESTSPDLLAETLRKASEFLKKGHRKDFDNK